MIKKIILWLIKRVTFAFLIIYGLDLLLKGFNIFVPINYYTVIIVTLLGFPGLILLALSYYEEVNMNEKLKQFILSGINEKNLSHAFLIETNNYEQTMNDIYEIFKETQTIAPSSLENNLSTLVVRPENNNIDKNKILNIQNFIITKIINNTYKIYFIINAEKMNQVSANKLLKILEEPSSNVIGFLITDSINSIMDTIKSRCELFENIYDTSLQTETNDLIDTFYKLQKCDNYTAILLKQNFLKYDKIELINKLSEIKIVLDKNINQSNYLLITKYYKLIDDIIKKLNANTNVEMCIDKLIIEMRK